MLSTTTLRLSYTDSKDINVVNIFHLGIRKSSKDNIFLIGGACKLLIQGQRYVPNHWPGAQVQIIVQFCRHGISVTQFECLSFNIIRSSYCARLWTWKTWQASSFWLGGWCSTSTNPFCCGGQRPLSNEERKKVYSKPAGIILLFLSHRLAFSREKSKPCYNWLTFALTSYVYVGCPITFRFMWNG